MGEIFFIKNGNFTPKPGQKVLKAADYALMAAAEEALETARREGETIREAAERAYEEEKERGYAEGLALGKMEMAERMLDTAARGVDYLEGLEGDVVDVVMNAMNKIIDGFSDKERVIGVVRKSLGYVRSQKRVVLRVAPEDAEMVQGEMRDLLRDYPGIGVLDVAADPRQQAGACILESELGLIDASLKVQLEGIRKAFMRRLKQSAGEK
jgi:type III secretion protein L